MTGYTRSVMNYTDTGEELRQQHEQRVVPLLATLPGYVDSRIQFALEGRSCEWVQRWASESYARSALVTPVYRQAVDLMFAHFEIGVGGGRVSTERPEP